MNNGCDPMRTPPRWSFPPLLYRSRVITADDGDRELLSGCNVYLLQFHADVILERIAAMPDWCGVLDCNSPTRIPDAVGTFAFGGVVPTSAVSGGTLRYARFAHRATSRDSESLWATEVQLRPTTGQRLIEWPLFASEPSLRQSRRVGPARNIVPLERQDSDDWTSRLDLLRDSHPEHSLIGIAVTWQGDPTLLDRIVAQPIDFLTLVDPAALLPDRHAGTALFPHLDMVQLEQLIAHIRGKRVDLPIIVQLPLASGYTAAAALAAGANSVVINASDAFDLTKLPSEAFGDPNPLIARAARDEAARRRTGAISRFVDEFLDGCDYIDR